jgi:hypothetical protein
VADALGITGPLGSDLALRSTDPADHLFLRWRVDGALAARQQLHEDLGRATADALTDSLST